MFESSILKFGTQIYADKRRSDIAEFVKSLKMLFSVIPVKTEMTTFYRTINLILFQDPENLRSSASD